MNSVLKFTVSSSVPSASIAWQPYTYWLLYEMKIIFIIFPFPFISMMLMIPRNADVDDSDADTDNELLSE